MIRTTRIFLGIGSNVDPATHVIGALRLLARHLTLTGVSTVYQTAPIGRPEQEDYYNAVCSATTDLPPLALHRTVLRAVEQDLGRKRSSDRYAARTIDLDLLLYGTMVLNHPELVLPSPDIPTRAFVCLPLLELDSTLTMPDSGSPLTVIAAGLAPATMTPLHDYTRTLREALNL